MNPVREIMTSLSLPARFAAFLQKFTILRSAPRELWIILAAYVLENVAYKLSSGPVLPLWLKHELGMSDQTKGLTIGIWSALLTFFTIMVGSFTDVVGIRRTFILGFIICGLARMGMMFTEPRLLPLGLGMLPLALGLALMTPVMTAAMKRYSTAAQRSVAFSLYYALMNLGFAIGDRLFDYFRAPNVMGEYGTWVVPWLGVGLSTYQVMILWSVILTVPGLLLTWWFLREGVEMTEDGVKITPLVRAKPSLDSLGTQAANWLGARWTGLGLAVRESWGRTWLRKVVLAAVLVGLGNWAYVEWLKQTAGVEFLTGFALWQRHLIFWIYVVAGVLAGIGVLVIGRDVAAHTSGAGAKTVALFESLWPEKAFHRFLAFMALVIGVRMIFYHMNYTLPDFAIRELGKGAPFAQVCNMLNSLMILFLVPICGALSGRFSAYRMVTVGSAISALSVFILVLPPVWFKPLADGWLGNVIVHQWLNVPGPVNPLYLSLFVFTVVLSIGEAIWSPRLYEYAAAIAPKGQEASYMALSVLPYFFAKFGAGSLSGWLLSRYCPEAGPRDIAVMWAWVGGMALITPVGAMVLRKYIQVHEEGRDENA
jgi:MFS family permease